MCMKLSKMSKKYWVYKLVLVLIWTVETTTAGLNMAEASKATSSVNIQAVRSHQKELVGSKRAPASVQGTIKPKKVKKAISQLVLEEATVYLPEEYRGIAPEVAKTIIKEANRYQMDPLFLVAVIKRESSFNPTMLGSFQEEGLMQIKPSTANWLNDKLKLGIKKMNLLDPLVNIKVGTAFFNYLRDRFEKDSLLYISAYNMGVANVNKLLKKNEKPKIYASKVMENYIELLEMLEISLMSGPFTNVAMN